MHVQVAQWFADANLVYEMQLNIVLQVAEIYQSDGTEVWDNGATSDGDCTQIWNTKPNELGEPTNYPDIEAQLELFGEWARQTQSSRGLWPVKSPDT